MYTVPDSASIQDVMDDIRQENPALWPYGLSVSMFDDVFPIKGDSDQVVGFTGWQFRKEKDQEKPVAYYSVGVRADHRGKGLATKALQRMIADKPKTVGEVKAFIVKGNKPSERLAAKLGVPVTHEPSQGLRASSPTRKVAAVMPRHDLAPRSSQGVSLHSYMPVYPRRSRLTPAEEQAIAAGKDQWMGRIFDSQSDSPAVDMSSPGKGAILGALLGGGLGGVLGAGVTGQKAPAFGAAGLGALIGALTQYYSREANNEDIIEKMRRIPPNGTRRDTLADPVYQAELDRRAMLQAATMGRPFYKSASGLGAVMRAFMRNPNTQAVAKTMLPSAGAAAFTDYMYNKDKFFTTDHAKDRVHTFIANTLLSAVPTAIARKATGARPVLNTSAGAPTAEAISAFNKAMNLRDLAGYGGAVAAVPGLVGKDFIMNAMYVPRELSSSFRDMSENMRGLVDAVSKKTDTSVNVTVPPSSGAPAVPQNSSILQWARENKGEAGMVGAGLLAALLGGGYMVNQGLDTLKDVASREEKGRIRVTLPTKKPGDAETQLDIPMRDIEVSDALFGRLRRDFRKRLQTETKERTRKVDLSPEEIERRRQLVARMQARRNAPLINI